MANKKHDNNKKLAFKPKVQKQNSNYSVSTYAPYPHQEKAAYSPATTTGSECSFDTDTTFDMPTFRAPPGLEHLEGVYMY